MGSHFLLNIINAVQSDIILKKNKEGFELIQLFNRVYKAAIRASNVQTHTISEEIAFLNAYLKLEQTRTTRSIPSLKCSVEDEEVSVPSFVFQSLVENALLQCSEVKGAKMSCELVSDSHNTRLILDVTPSPSAELHDKTFAKTQLAIDRFNQLVEANIIQGRLEWNSNGHFLIVQLNH